jgi:hypothetical protein
MSTITVQSPIKVATPRGATVAVAVVMAVWRWVEAAQRARAERRVQAARLAEAAELRAYALRFTRHDPRFTSDLLAAADRHERGG